MIEDRQGGPADSGENRGRPEKVRFLAEPLEIGQQGYPADRELPRRDWVS